MSARLRRVSPARGARQRGCRLVLYTLSARASRGTLVCGPLALACALGRSGRRWRKREGDGATPAGAWAVREGFYRRDRLMRPRTALRLRPLGKHYGWCDAPGDRNYNRLVKHPYPASAEHLWREDGLYDLLLVLEYNTRPRIQGRGSAIFLHAATEDFAPTAGCLAVRPKDLLKLLALPARRLNVRIG